ncbi:N-acyl-aromatic-L-amino acid amidohydrolase (carboxylate-forming) B-like [Brachionichthys hirsutus]|uniref:N-acyl-aromatic-L-amino acid amidohydrolase (carboxylate-forming) B-like n=1 Tax=Brachionichthys hirsutus TaxID=412623 RepID=UPI003604FAAD
MEHVFFPPLTRVAICGGTHGNEMSGVYLVREMLKQKLDQAGSLSVTPILSNPRAIEVCKRYIDTDLNRSFSDASLRAPLTDSTPYEVRRAQELDAQLGPRGSPEAVDCICDLHNTTANMGLCVMTSTIDWINLHIFKYIQSKVSSVPVRAIHGNAHISENCFLDSLATHGYALEIGPQPNGVIRADIYNAMKQGVDLTFEWLQSFNSGSTFEGGEIEIYTAEKKIDYPRDPATNEITAVIHPQLQDNDFKLLRPGDPIFQTFLGESVLYEGEELYPFFINECAYYEKKVAFILSRKITVALPSVSVKRD